MVPDKAKGAMMAVLFFLSRYSNNANATVYFKL